MQYKNGIYTKYDMEAAKILDSFLPNRLFDAHAHLYHESFMDAGANSVGAFSIRKSCYTEDYITDMRPLIGERQVRLNIVTSPDAKMSDPRGDFRRRSVDFLVGELERYPENVGEVMVGPHDTAEEVEAMLRHPRIRGFKCYHLLADKKPTFNAGIGEYLPESVWEVANRRGLAITLHMVKDRALSDPENLSYIKAMAKKYPSATLILAHAARSFAAWTALESVDEVKSLENVWFDFSGVCEPTAEFQIMRKCGIDRCMWGSDYPISRLVGKAISLADSFYWIDEHSLSHFSALTEFHAWLVGTENLMALRQAALMLDLSEGALEKLFYDNAASLFDK